MEEAAEELKLYTFNQKEVGKLSVREEGILINLNDIQFLLPSKSIRAANIGRVGKVNQHIYALKIFMNLDACAVLKSAMQKLSITLDSGLKVNADSFSNVTGEYAEFFISSSDVLGRENKSKKVLEAINGTIKGLHDE